MIRPTDDATEAKLDALLSGARAQKASVPLQLTERVLADAEFLQPKTPAIRPRQTPNWRLRRFGLFSAVGGLAAASCAGFWIGINPPDMLMSLPLPGLEAANATTFEGGVDMTGFGWDLGEI